MLQTQFLCWSKSDAKSPECNGLHMLSLALIVSAIIITLFAPFAMIATLKRLAHKVNRIFWMATIKLTILAVLLFFELLLYVILFVIHLVDPHRQVYWNAPFAWVYLIVLLAYQACILVLFHQRRQNASPVAFRKTAAVNATLQESLLQDGRVAAAVASSSAIRLQPPHHSMQSDGDGNDNGDDDESLTLSQKS